MDSSQKEQSSPVDGPATGAAALKEMYDVTVVGAGISGLVAACSLAEQGKKVCLLEADRRVGGRILSVDAYPGFGLIDMGGELLEGQDSPLTRMAEENGWSKHEVFDDQFVTLPRRSGRSMYYSAGSLEYDDGKLFKSVSTAWSQVEESWRAMQPPAADTPNIKGDSASGTEVKDDSVAQLLKDKSIIESDIGYQLLASTICQRDGVDIENCSAAMESEGWDYGSLVQRFDGSFRVLLDFYVTKAHRLRNLLTVKLEQEVTYVSTNKAADGQQQCRCLVRTSDDSLYRSSVVLITVPLGVLKLPRIVFYPPLPDRIQSSLRSMAMGNALKLHLRFAVRVWPADLGILYIADGFFKQFWVDAPRRFNAQSAETTFKCKAECPTRITTGGAGACGGCSRDCCLPCWKRHLLPQVRQASLPAGSASKAETPASLPAVSSSASACCCSCPHLELSAVGVHIVQREDVLPQLEASLENSGHSTPSSCRQQRTPDSGSECYCIFGFATNIVADLMEEECPSAMVLKALDQLDTMFGNRGGSPAQPATESFAGAMLCCWGQQQFTQGGYRAPTVNVGKAQQQFSQPVDDCLFFAGEHTHQYLSSVHTAMESGTRAVEQIMSTLKAT